MRWGAGEADIEQLLAERHLERVQGAQADGGSWLDRARQALDAARLIADAAPDSSIILAYDAARQACIARCSPSRACAPPQPAATRPLTMRSAPSSALACEPSEGCAAGATNWNTRTTRPRKPAPARPLKHCRLPARSSTPPPGSSSTSDSSEPLTHRRDQHQPLISHAAALGRPPPAARGARAHLRCSCLLFAPAVTSGADSRSGGHAPAAGQYSHSALGCSSNPAGDSPRSPAAGSPYSEVPSSNGTGIALKIPVPLGTADDDPGTWSIGRDGCQGRPIL